MLTKKLETALNEQINAEIWSAYLYLSMSAYLGSKGLSGMAHWMRLQYEEELTHGLKFLDYIIDKGGTVALKPIGKVQTSWKTPLEVFEDSRKHEQAVTQMINKLVDLSIEESDHATRNMLTWFINEQVEEEATVTAIIDNLKLIKDNGVGLYMLDKELAQRTLTTTTNQ